MIPWLPIRPTRALVDAREERVICGGCQREIAWALIGTWSLELTSYFADSSGEGQVLLGDFTTEVNWEKGKLSRRVQSLSRVP